MQEVRGSTPLGSTIPSYLIVEFQYLADLSVYLSPTTSPLQARTNPELTGILIAMGRALCSTSTTALRKQGGDGMRGVFIGIAGRWGGCKRTDRGRFDSPDLGGAVARLSREPSGVTGRRSP